MASFTTSARQGKKENRRSAQAAKIAEHNKQDDDYFWQCVQNEERNKAANKFIKPSFATQDKLFERQGTSGINFEQYDAIPVTRSGPDSSNIPEVGNFINLRASLPQFLSENLTGSTRMNYSTPTPIQRHCVPLSLSGKFDVMACAQTGSGKTVAFLVPLVAHIASQPKVKVGKGGGPRVTPAMPSAVVVAPTRELAIQIELEAHKLTFSSALHCVCVYGGAPTRVQLALLAKGVDILVATPGRLTDFLQRGLIKLAATKFVVLDEADRMLDMGFEPQIRQICERFDLPAAHARRTLMFSATFPDEVQKIAQKYMRAYVFVAVGRVGSTINSITQRLVLSPMNDKRSKLEIVLPLIDRSEKTLVFCQKKHVASWVRGQIVKELPGIKADAIHGDRSQSQRESALGKFRSGDLDVLVATDVAARGLDVPNITHVIQFDLPVAKDDFDSYVHRIGRTGRAGRLGVATSLFVPGMDGKSGQNGGLWEPLHKLLEEGQQEVPAWFADLGPRSERSTAGAGTGRGGSNSGSGSGSGSRKGAQQPQRDSRSAAGVVTTTVSVTKTGGGRGDANSDPQATKGQDRQRGKQQQGAAKSAAHPNLRPQGAGESVRTQTAVESEAGRQVDSRRRRKDGNAGGGARTEATPGPATAPTRKDSSANGSTKHSQVGANASVPKQPKQSHQKGPLGPTGVKKPQDVRSSTSGHGTHNAPVASVSGAKKNNHTINSREGGKRT